jgi:hypothetical protein
MALEGQVGQKEMKCILKFEKYFHMSQCYSGERCGPWASCLFIVAWAILSAIWRQSPRLHICTATWDIGLYGLIGNNGSDVPRTAGIATSSSDTHGWLYLSREIEGCCCCCCCVYLCVYVYFNWKFYHRHINTLGIPPIE